MIVEHEVHVDCVATPEISATCYHRHHQEEHLWVAVTQESYPEPGSVGAQGLR